MYSAAKNSQLRRLHVGKTFEVAMRCPDRSNYPSDLQHPMHCVEASSYTLSCGFNDVLLPKKEGAKT